MLPSEIIRPVKSLMNHYENLADLIEASMKKYHSFPAYECFGQTLTFADIDDKSLAFAAWLQQKSGLKAGDRVIIQLPNIIQYPIVVYAVLRAGMVIVNANPLYTEREMLHQFTDSGAKAIIILSNLLPKLTTIKVKTAIEQVVVTSALDLLSDDNASNNGGISFNQAIALGEKLSLQPRAENKAHEICALQYTGGTTGISKGACLTHANILSCANQLKMHLGQTITAGQEIAICPLPLYHIYAFTVNMITMFSEGNLNVLIANPRDIDGFIQTLAQHRVTFFSGINTLFVGLTLHPDLKKIDFSSLKLTISGGATLPPSTAHLWKKLTQCSITEGYGLSESSAVVCINEPGNEQLGTVGIPTTATEVQLWNANNEEVAEREEGQIVVRGPQMFQGYWNMPEETAEAITEDGFFKTGDIGVRLENGCIKIVDRLKDMVIVSGFNVYPNEVEEVLTNHPNIIEAAVIGEQDDKTGEKVCAFITVTNDIDIKELILFCRQQLTAYKVPKKIVVLDELPKSTIGKILRRKLRTT